MSYRKLPLHPEQETELKSIREISRLLIRVVSIRVPEIYAINYDGVKPRPTDGELINLNVYPFKYHDRSATFTRDSPLLTQFDGIGMMELQEQEQQ